MHARVCCALWRACVVARGPEWRLCRVCVGVASAASFIPSPAILQASKITSPINIVTVLLLQRAPQSLLASPKHYIEDHHQ